MHRVLPSMAQENNFRWVMTTKNRSMYMAIQNGYLINTYYDNQRRLIHRWLDCVILMCMARKRAIREKWRVWLFILCINYAIQAVLNCLRVVMVMITASNAAILCMSMMW